MTFPKKNDESGFIKSGKNNGHFTWRCNCISLDYS